MRMKIAVISLVVFLGIGGFGLYAQNQVEPPLVKKVPVPQTEAERITDLLTARNPGLELKLQALTTKDFADVKFSMIDEKLQKLIDSKPIGLKVIVADFDVLNTVHLRVGDYKDATYQVVLHADTDEILEGHFGNIAMDNEVERAGKAFIKCGTMDGTVTDTDLVSEYRLRTDIEVGDKDQHPRLIDSLEKWQSFLQQYPARTDWAMYIPPSIGETYFKKNALYAVPIQNTSGDDVITPMKPTIAGEQLILSVEKHRMEKGYMESADWVALFGIAKAMIPSEVKVNVKDLDLD